MTFPTIPSCILKLLDSYSIYIISYENEYAAYESYISFDHVGIKVSHP